MEILYTAANIVHPYLHIPSTSRARMVGLPGLLLQTIMLMVLEMISLAGE
jgi:hypothetical protein